MRNSATGFDVFCCKARVGEMSRTRSQWQRSVMKAPDEAKNGIDDAIAEQLLLLQDTSTQVLVYFDRLTSLSCWNPEHEFILVSQKRFMVS
jgi:hypothetical protein